MFDQKSQSNGEVVDGTHTIKHDGEEEFDIALQNTASRRQGSIASIHDAVFGDVTEGGPNYRSVCPNRCRLFTLPGNLERVC